MKPCQKELPPKGWVSLRELLTHIRDLGTSSVPGAVGLRDVARRCCVEPSGPRHRPLWKMKMCDRDVRALVADALLRGDW